MATQKDVKNRISSVKNIRKITRAMEMVAAARLRRAEQRIDQMRPYAQAIRRITQRVAEAAGPAGNRVAVLQQRDEVKRGGIMRGTGDRGLAGSSAPAPSSSTRSRPRARRSPTTWSAVAATRR